MNIKKGDKVILKNDCMIGHKGDVWTIESVDCDYVDASHGRFSYVTMSVNVFKRYFDVQDEEKPKARKTTWDDVSESGIRVEKEPVIDCCSVPFNKVSAAKIDEIINQSDIVVDTVWDKCTIVSCKLPNGFIINESSACVDSANYDEELGYKICMKRIRDKVWELEGYLLAEKLNDSLYNDNEEDYYDDYDCDEDYDDDDCLMDCCNCPDYSECYHR